MAKEPPRYPQVTEDQIELWRANAVTRAYLSALEFKRLDIRDAAGVGKLTDSSNADLTHALLHRALGQQDGLSMAAQPESLLEDYGLILHPEPDEESDGSAT